MFEFKQFVRLHAIDACSWLPMRRSGLMCKGRCLAQTKVKAGHPFACDRSSRTD